MKIRPCPHWPSVAACCWFPGSVPAQSKKADDIVAKIQIVRSTCCAGTCVTDQNQTKIVAANPRAHGVRRPPSFSGPVYDAVIHGRHQGE
jgi:hypothetical protein